ncbi:MAG: hypothetical protein ACT4P0_07460 [Panacagrimonas sp.]
MKAFLANLWLSAALALAATSAQAWADRDLGTFAAVDEQGQPSGKVMRVSRRGDAWKFEDRQPDGSWIDVTCQGGCQHQAASSEQVIEFFGSPPPPTIRPECVHNSQYAFCHFSSASGQNDREGFALVVKIGERWMPITLARMPGGEQDEPTPEAPQLEAASLR